MKQQENKAHYLIHEKLTQMYNSNETNIIIIDKNLDIIHSSDALCNLLQKDRNKIIGKKCYHILDNKLCPTHNCTVSRLLNGKIHISSSIDIKEQKNCRILNFILNATPLWDLTGNIAGVVIFLEDITKKKLTDLLIEKYQKKLKDMTYKLSLAEEQERRNIATDIHDEIGQILALTSTKLSVLEQDSLNEKAHKTVKEIHNLINEAISKIRSLTFQLSSPLLHKFGIIPAIKWLLEEYEERFGIQTSFSSDTETIRLDKNLNILLYKVINELLNNIIKHAKAKNIIASIRPIKDFLIITVTDDGIGFNISNIDNSFLQHKGFGLFNISERIKYIGGDIEIYSRPGEGTRITLRTPRQIKKEIKPE